MKRVLSLLLALILISISSFSKNNQETIFKPKEIKKVMMTAALWQLKNPKHELWDWTNGAFYSGISAAYKTTDNKKLLKAMIEMGDKNEWKPGPRLQHADDYAICQTYVEAYRAKKDQKMVFLKYK